MNHMTNSSSKHSEHMHQNPTPVAFRGYIKHKSSGSVERQGVGRQVQTELMLLTLNEDQPQLIWMGSQQSVWDASHLKATGSACIYSHQNPLSSQSGSNLTSTEAEGKRTSEWPCKVIRTTAATQFGPLQPPLSDLTATVRPAFPLSEQCQCASSCLSIFNYPVKLHYITCTKSHPIDS